MDETVRYEVRPMLLALGWRFETRILPSCTCWALFKILYCILRISLINAMRVRHA